MYAADEQARPPKIAPTTPARVSPRVGYCSRPFLSHSGSRNHFNDNVRDALPVACDFIENQGAVYVKQDCEIKAFHRLEPKLKRLYPQTPFWLYLMGFMLIRTSCVRPCSMDGTWPSHLRTPTCQPCGLKPPTENIRITPAHPQVRSPAVATTTLLADITAATTTGADHFLNH